MKWSLYWEEGIVVVKGKDKEFLKVWSEGLVFDRLSYKRRGLV